MVKIYLYSLTNPEHCVREMDVTEAVRDAAQECHISEEEAAHWIWEGINETYGNDYEVIRRNW